MIKRLLMFTAFSALIPLSQAQAAPDMNFTVTASEAVTVDTTGGTPRLALDIGGVTRYASYASGSGSANLTFTYTTQAGDIDLDGITVTSPLQMNGGTIMDAAGNALSPLTFSVPTTTGILVDHPSLAMNFVGNDYILNGTHYNSLTSFLTAAGGSFSRASVGTYFDASGNIQTAASGVPRFTHDRVTNAPQGLMIEESRTNYTPNSTFTGVTGGTYTVSTSMPGWRIEIPPTLTGEIVDITPGTQSGLNYLDIRMRAGNSTGATMYLAFHPTATLDAPVSNGTISIGSAWVGITAHSGVCTMALQNRSMTSTAIYLPSTSPVFTGFTPFQPRITASLTHGATAARGALWLFMSIPDGATCDITTRYAAPQFEIGAFATSFIPTTTTAVTRANENMTIPTGSWYASAGGTMYGQGVAASGVRTAGDQSLASFDAGAANGTFMRLGRTSGRLSRVQHSVAGTTYASLIDAAWNDRTTGKIATSFTANNFAGSYNGRTPQTSSSGPMPTVTRLTFSAFANDASSFWNGSIQNFKYYPSPATSTQIRLLTQ